MLRISKWKQWKSRTTTADLLRLMDIHHLRYYIDQRALRWTNTRASGHPRVPHRYHDLAGELLTTKQETPGCSAALGRILPTTATSGSKLPKNISGSRFTNESTTTHTTTLIRTAFSHFHTPTIIADDCFIMLVFARA